MEPFPVLCETCGAKLKVRDPAAVGQIHACPKCDSMVMVAAPASWTNDVQSSAAAAVPTPAPPEGETLVPSDFAAEVDDLLATATEPNTANASPDTDLTYDQPPAEEQVAEAAPTSAGLSQTGLMVWGVAGSVAFFSLGLLAAAWWTGNPDVPAQAVVAGDTSTSESEVQGSSTDEPTATDSPMEQVEVSKPVVETTIEEPAAEDAPVIASLPELPPVASEVVSDAVDEEEELASAPHLMPLDPLSVDSANLDLLLIPDRATTPQPQPPAIQEEQTAASTPAIPDIAPAAPKLRFEPGSASPGPTFAEGLAEGELTSRLEVRLPAVAWRQAPFCQAAAELSQLSSVPITIDPFVLRMAAIRATQPVSLEQSNASVHELASAIANAVRLELIRTPGGLAFEKSKSDGWRTVTYNVDDLVRGQDATGLVTLIREFATPDAWASNRAIIESVGSEIEVNQQLVVHYKILLFCERLRMARRLTPRSKYPAKLIDVEPRLAELSNKLGRSTTFAFVGWTPLTEVFDHWQQSSNVVMLADWQRLADLDVRPQSTMSGSVNNVTWSAALDACLTPLGVAWTPVDGNTLQITTSDAANATTWVEFYAKAKAEAVRERVEARCDVDDLTTFKLAGDDSGRFVIVRGNRAVHEVAQP